MAPPCCRPTSTRKPLLTSDHATHCQISLLSTTSTHSPSAVHHVHSLTLCCPPRPLTHPFPVAIGASVGASVPLMSIISMAGVRLRNILPLNFLRPQTHITAVNRREPPNGFQPWNDFCSLLAAFKQEVLSNPESSIEQFHPIDTSTPPPADHECNIEIPVSQRVTSPINKVRNINIVDRYMLLSSCVMTRHDSR